MNYSVEWGLGLGASVVCLVLAAVFTWLPKFAGLKWARALVLPAVMSGVSGILQLVVLGHTLSDVVGGGLGAARTGATSIAPGVRYVIPIVFALVVLAVFAHEVWTVSVSKKGTASAAILPAVVGALPGALGVWTVAILGIIPLAFGAAFAALLGLR